MRLALAVALCLASGDLIVRVAWPRLAKGTDRLLKWSLAVGFGLGFSSATFFVARALNLEHFLAIDVLCFALLLGSYFLGGEIDKRHRFPSGSPITVLSFRHGYIVS